MAAPRRPAPAPRRAMVLAAGLGTRMRPFNGQIPKPLVTVGSKALIESAITMMQATPSTWRMLIDSGLTGSPALKVLCG